MSHPDFRMVVLANRPGFPFLGNDFFGAMGMYIISSPELRLRGELIVYRSSRRPSVRACVGACVRVFTLSNISLRPMRRLQPKHHLGGGLAARGFGPDRIRTLVSMATESSHR